MSKYQLNIIPFQPKSEVLQVQFSKDFQEGFTKIPKKFLPKGFMVEEDIDYYYFKKSFNSDGNNGSDNNYTEVSLKDNKRFSQYYFNNLILNTICKEEIKYRINFISVPTFFIPSKQIIYQNFRTFKKFTVRALTDRFKKPFSLLISFEGLSYLSKTSLKEMNVTTDLINLVDTGSKELSSFPKLSLEDQEMQETIYPFLNFDLQNKLGIVTQQFKPENKYKENYQNIKDFITNHLIVSNFENELILNPSFFYEVPSDLINETSSGSNLLEFGNNGSNFSPYHGLKEHGPFSKPPDDKIKLIFIFHKDDSDTANKLFSYFKKGYKSYPGLYEFVKVPVDIDVQNSIKYTSDSNPITEISNQLNPDRLDGRYRYAAIYISRIKKDDQDDGNQAQYYKIKELLLRYSITSQVIYKENIDNDYFNFFLPNISIALLAKLDGVPWKLKRPKRNDLVVGIGAYNSKSLNQRYLGNAFYFKNDGTFHEFDSFTKKDIDSLSNTYESSVKEYMKEFGDPSRLIIHFYKSVSYEDVKCVEKVLSKLSLSIPIIIISINKTESQDFVLYDTTFDGLMPKSGTYVQIGRNEFLLCNNSRYSSNTGSYIESFPFPIKFKIHSTDNSLLDNKEQIRELIDQIYQFSRMYWKSVRQKNLPVTIEYSEIIAEIFSNFESETLPEFGKKNLWFL
ncbi:MAG: hypothetical protein H6539_00030 [Bacteroidales bacterium]|nr:hypothetical protein [Bacteroidales bacterium]